MKLFYTFLFVLAIASNSFADWQPTSVSTNPAEIVYDVAEHNGSLFAAINSKGLVNYNGSSWDSVAVVGFTVNVNSVHIERIISCGNVLYAVVQDQKCASSMIYKSADDGLTFVADTANLPKLSCDNKPMNVNFLYTDGTYLFLTLTSGINTYRKSPADMFWSVMPAEVKFSSRFAGADGKWYGFYHSLVVSDNYGQSWTSATNKGLPTSNIANGLSIDPSNKRIYLPLEIYSNYSTKLMYTEDEGESWDSLAVGQYLSKDWIGLKIQRIVSFISDGDFIELGLVNNKSKTTPDFLVSTDAGVTFTVDTLGLPNDNWGTMAARAMVFYKKDLYAAIGADVYKKTLNSSGIGEVSNSRPHHLYPNPTSGVVNISNLTNETVEMYDLQGHMLFSERCSTFNIDGYPSGIYYVKIISENRIEMIKLVKN